MPVTMDLNGQCVLVFVLVCALTIPRPASAQGTALRFFGGAATALVAHESGHLLLDGVFDAGVGIRRVNAGPLPFFAITHHPVSPAREFAISSAGFWIQHLSDEVLLSRRPNLRNESSPFVKGMLAFNVLTSVGYSVAAFAGRGPDERDTRGMALSMRVDEPWAGAVILAPALLDGARFYRPQQEWLKWASRAAKVGGALLIIRAAN